jgi:hypothetical protein
MKSAALGRWAPIKALLLDTRLSIPLLDVAAEQSLNGSAAMQGLAESAVIVQAGEWLFGEAFAQWPNMVKVPRVHVV